MDSVTSVSFVTKDGVSGKCDLIPKAFADEFGEGVDVVIGGEVDASVLSLRGHVVRCNDEGSIVSCGGILVSTDSRLPMDSEFELHVCVRGSCSLRVRLINNLGT